MKTSTLLGSYFLLAVTMAMSWGAAVPLEDTHILQDINLEDQLQVYLENNPSIVRELYPELLREASQVLVVVDPDTLVEMLRRHEAVITPEVQDEMQEDAKEGEEKEKGTQEDHEEKHDRKKRQVSFGFGMNRGPHGRDYNANVGYQRRFNNGRSSIGVNGHRNWGASGRSHGFGISFSHRFRR